MPRSSFCCSKLVPLLVLLTAVYIGTLYFQPADYITLPDGRLRFVSLAEPKHPVWLSVVKALVTPLASPLIVGDSMFNASAIIASAQQRTGLHDLGEYEELARAGLECLLSSMQSEARLHALGTLLNKEFLVSRVEGLLRLVDLLKRFPAIRDEPISAPLIIAALPRSGSTHLHALLAASGDFRFFPYFETAHPFDFGVVEGEPEVGKVKEPVDEKGSEKAAVKNPQATLSEQAAAHREKVIATTEMEERIHHALAPLFPSMVNITATAPMEETMFETLLLWSSFFPTLYRVPTYSQKLNRDFDQLHAVKFIKTAMQASQWNDRRTSPDPASFVPRRWLLKSPNNLYRLPEIVSVFPDAVFVFTHRDLMSMLESGATMMSYLMRLYTDHIATEECALEFFTTVTKQVGTFMKDIDGLRVNTTQQVIHLTAQEYWGNQEKTIARIYALTGSAPGPESQERMHQYIHDHPRMGANTFQYSLDSVGVTQSELCIKFGNVMNAYTAKFTSSPAPC